MTKIGLVSRPYFNYLVCPNIYLCFNNILSNNPGGSVNSFNSTRVISRAKMLTTRKFPTCASEVDSPVDARSKVPVTCMSAVRGACRSEGQAWETNPLRLSQTKHHVYSRHTD